MDILILFLVAIVATPIVITLFLLKRNTNRTFRYKIFLGVSILFSVFSAIFLLNVLLSTLGGCGGGSGNLIRCETIPELTTLVNILNFGSSWAGLVYVYYWVIGLFIYLIAALGLFGGVVLRTCAVLLLAALVLGTFFIFFFKGSSFDRESQEIISVPAGTF